MYTVTHTQQATSPRRVNQPKIKNDLVAKNRVILHCCYCYSLPWIFVEKFAIQST